MDTIKQPAGTEVKPLSSKAKERTAVAAKPKRGTPEWEKTLHPDVQRFLKASKKLDWSKV